MITLLVYSAAICWRLTGMPYLIVHLQNYLATYPERKQIVANFALIMKDLLYSVQSTLSKEETTIFVTP